MEPFVGAELRAIRQIPIKLPRMLNILTDDSASFMAVIAPARLLSYCYAARVSLMTMYSQSHKSHPLVSRNVAAARYLRNNQ